MPAAELGEPGIYIAGVDAIAHRVLTSYATELGGSDGKPGAVAQVLGPRTAQVSKHTHSQAWAIAADEHGAGLGPELCTPSFLESEYATIVLPNLVTTREEYLKARRTGRGVSLNRARRNAVWDVIEAYRAAAAADGTTDFEEKSAIAAQVLRNINGRGLADHVLVDEAQDLSPSRLMLLRALAAPGKDDLFIAEDSHQRIYGQPIVLGRYSINIVGRARRLTLNYRTTEQNLRYALGILSGAEYTDLVDEPESTDATGRPGAARSRAPSRRVHSPTNTTSSHTPSVSGSMRRWPPNRSVCWYPPARKANHYHAPSATAGSRSPSSTGTPQDRQGPPR